MSEVFRAKARRKYVRTAPAPGPRPSAKVGLAQMRRATTPGECPFCGDPLAKPGDNGKERRHCGEPECETAYHRHFKRDQRRGRYVHKGKE